MGGGSIQHVTNKNNNYYFEVDNRFEVIQLNNSV